MKKSIIIPTLLMSASALFAQTEVEQYRPGVTVDGVTYYLPRTALRITVETETTTTHPGELNEYAFRFLRLKDVPRETSQQCVIKSVKVEPYSLPDASKAYTIRLKAKSTAPLVSLTRDGILLSINKETEEQKFLGELPQDVAETKHDDPHRYLSQDVLAAGSTYKQAELIALQIQDIRESRSSLIKGEADNTPKDGQQLKLMLDELNNEASALEELFKGYSSTSTYYSVFTYEPLVSDTTEVLFRFSPTLGVIDPDRADGTPVNIVCQALEKLPTRQSSEDSDKKKAKMETGVIYNVPAREAISLTFGQQTLFSEEYSMGQFGNTEILSNTLFDKKNTFKATFDQMTGGVKKVSE